MQKTNYELALKFQEVKHSNNNNDGTFTWLPFFIYPSINYQSSLKELNQAGDGVQGIAAQKLKDIDWVNKDRLFEYLCYEDELREFVWEAKAFPNNENVKIMEIRLRTFLENLCDYILTMTTNLYYKNIHKHVLNAPFIDIFVDGRGEKFTLQKSFSYALQEEKYLREQFIKILYIEYPQMKIKNVVNNNKRNNKQEEKNDKQEDKKHNKKHGKKTQ